MEDVVLVALLRLPAARDSRQAAVEEQPARREVVPDWQLLRLEHGLELSRTAGVYVKDDRDGLDFFFGVHIASIRQLAPAQRSGGTRVADFLTPIALQVAGEHASQGYEPVHSHRADHPPGGEARRLRAQSLENDQALA